MRFMMLIFFPGFFIIAETIFGALASPVEEFLRYGN